MVKISIIVDSDVALMNSYVSGWMHWRRIMNILNYLLCALFVLSMACNKAVKEVGSSDKILPVRRLSPEPVSKNV